MDNGVKIVHVCLCGATTDGFSYQENLLAKYHRKMGYAVTLIASQWINDTSGGLTTTAKTDYRNGDDVKVVRIPMLFGTIDTRLKIYPGIISVIEKEAPDILFVHACQFLDIVRIAGFLKRNPNVRCYVDNHADYSNSASGWLSRNVLHRLIWRFCAGRIEPYVRYFYGVMPARVDFLKELYRLPEEKCRLLVMGADDDLAETAGTKESVERTRVEHGIAAQDFLIVTGGKIDAWKPQTLLLMKAVQELQVESSKAAECQIAGRSVDMPRNIRLLVFGSVVKELREQFDALVDGTVVQYLGWQDNEAGYRLLAAADLAVFPGRHSVYWEQTAGQGIPMVVKDWEGTHHVDLGGNVRFLTEDSEEEIRDVLEEIVGNPDAYAAMKKTAQEKGPKVFRYSRIAAESIEEGESHMRKVKGAQEEAHSDEKDACRYCEEGFR